MAAKRRVWRGLLAWGVLVTGGIILSAAATGWMWLRSSLPRQSGELAIAGLQAPVTIERDHLAVPRIVAQSFEDAARAQGFIHAQERFFQMDMSRRAAAGELSAIVGPLTLNMDREARAFRFRKVAREALKNLTDEQRKVVDAYTQGVNAGLADLAARPPEYLALRADPEPWAPEDCFLTILTMFRFLNYTAQWEPIATVLNEALGGEVAAFLTPEVTRWDAPQLVTDEPAERAAMQPMPVPGPDLINLRAATIPPRSRAPQSATLTFAALREALVPEGATLGSNNWAVSAARSKHNAAMVANDMHLGLTIPNTWFRVQLEWPNRRAVGVSLPGAPGLVAGSTNDLAWGYTNVEADVQDHVVIELNPDDKNQYRTPDGWATFGDDVEHLGVRARRESEELHVRTTIWGPIVGHDHKSRPIALRWTALDPDKLNLAVLDMLLARNVDEGVAVAQRMSIPAQNVVMADASGRIAWTLAGWLPARVGFDGKRSISWASAPDGAELPRWSGQLAPALRPTIIDPPSGAIWTANGRTAGFPQSRLVGTTFSPSDRASRIGELLAAADAFDEASLHAIALDTRVRPLDLWKTVFLDATANAPDPLVTHARALVELWNGHADPDQHGYRILRAFRREVSTPIFDAVEALCADVQTNLQYAWPLSDEPLTRILESRAPNWLPPGDWSDWPSFLAHAARSAVQRVDANGGIERPWGEINRLNVGHLLARDIPLVSGWLALPDDPLPGSGETVRAQGRTFGASERFVVSPARLEHALFSMPAGQSGHFLSPHYRDGHAAWAQGQTNTLLAGPAVHTLRLIPKP